MDKKTNFQAEVNQFLRSTHELAAANRTDVGKRITEVLKSIAFFDAIYGVIAEAMINYDFIEDWKRATRGTRLVLPADDTGKIAFIFSMLNNIDDKVLDLFKVLEHYFAHEGSTSPFENFISEVVLPFGELVAGRALRQVESNGAESANFGAKATVVAEDSKFEAAGGEKPQDFGAPVFNQSRGVASTEREKISHEVFGQSVEFHAKTEEEAATTGELVDGIVYLLGELEKILKSARRIKIILFTREELTALISSFKSAAKNNERHCFYGFSVALSKALFRAKETREIISEIELIVEELMRRK